MTINQNLSTYLPNVLLDAVSFGFEAVVMGTTSAMFASALAPFRHDPGPQSRRLVLKVPLFTDTCDLGAVTAILYLSPGGGGEGFIIGAKSSINLNPMDMLRRDLGLPDLRGLDGAQNLIGPHPADAIPLLSRQLSLVEQAIEVVGSILSNALGDGDARSDILRLRTAEACRDIGSPDAIGLVRRLQRSVLAGTLYRAADCYRQGALDEAGVPTVRWWPNKLAPVRKAYAKQAGLVRAEVTCRNRDSVVDFLGTPPAGTFEGAEALRQLVLFTLAAEPVLDVVAQHLHQVEGQSRSLASLFLDLLPLADLSAGRRSGPGAPPDKRSQAIARAALDALVTDGAFLATNLPKSGAVRQVLERLTEPDGPLVRRGKRAIYAVRPEKLPS